ncbi:hypothetical protein BDZ89DRAFT_552104 [Hymenopellis radicata]|nr:hypothetical protein BDZ89DRAFT_552104 [Hymenopellis radicata]
MRRARETDTRAIDERDRRARLDEKETGIVVEAAVLVEDVDVVVEAGLTMVEVGRMILVEVDEAEVLVNLAHLPHAYRAHRYLIFSSKFSRATRRYHSPEAKSRRRSHASPPRRRRSVYRSRCPMIKHRHPARVVTRHQYRRQTQLRQDRGAIRLLKTQTTS